MTTTPTKTATATTTALTTTTTPTTTTMAKTTTTTPTTTTTARTTKPTTKPTTTASTTEQEHVSQDPLEGDRLLIDGFRRGDRAALARVFLRYAPDVARQVRSTRAPEHEVESLVHEVFAKAFAEKARLAWDGLRPFGAWLSTITKNVVIDRVRVERRLDSRSPEDMPVLVADDDPAAAQEARELDAILQGFRTGLDDDDAALFRVRFEEQRSLAQAAAELGWSEIRVRKRDTAVRAALLDVLRGAGFLKDARVRIGTSLLRRRTRTEG
jgi:RNA polymerase sigma-70 factor (ECF subfamily)